MESEIKFIIAKDMGIEMPKGKELKTFQNFFTFIRKSLKIKYTRNIHIDSILKKCKSKFYKAVNDCIKKCVKLHIKKVPQTFITNISIRYNRQFLECTIYELYKIFNLIPFPIETILQQEYCLQSKVSFLKYILLSKVDDLYSVYIQSKRYKKEIELMKKRKGTKLTYLYQFVAENLVNYYYYSTPHTKDDIIFKEKNVNKNYISNNKKFNIFFKKDGGGENKNENINDNKDENKNENIDDYINKINKNINENININKNMNIIGKEIKNINEVKQN